MKSGCSQATIRRIKMYKSRPNRNRNGEVRVFVLFALVLALSAIVASKVACLNSPSLSLATNTTQITVPEPFTSKELPVARIMPDRRWFG